jgi:hypothetical protein
VIGIWEFLGRNRLATRHNDRQAGWYAVTDKIDNVVITSVLSARDNVKGRSAVRFGVAEFMDLSLPRHSPPGSRRQSASRSRQIVDLGQAWAL